MPAHDLALLTEAALRSGEIALRFWKRTPRFWDKGGTHGPVTEADIAVNDMLAETLRAARPDYGWLSEETVDDGTRHAAERVFIIDPIDGTRAFITGSPLWGTLIALNDGERAVIGVLDQPFLKERFWGVSLPTWREAGIVSPKGRRALTTRACARLEDAVLSSTTIEMFKGGQLRAFEGLMGRARLTRFGGDCYQYGLLAHGFMDLVVETSLAPYDIQALIPIIEGAGGAVTDWQGRAADQGGSVVAAGDPRAHALALEALAGAV